MAIFTGTDGDDEIRPGYVSPGVVANPFGATPGDDPDSLYGGQGDDQLDSGGGDDDLFGGDGGDELSGGAGDDELYGGDGNDRLNGGAGHDTLWGDPGADTMRGGPGHDSYFVDDPGDLAVEESSDSLGGLDSVYSTVSFSLGLGVENLVLLGWLDIDGTGNDLDNDLFGNGKSNSLGGGAGGDDLYGQGGADQLRGGLGPDDLDGGRGKDRLTGGRGNDDFVFAAPNEGGDTISDFRDREGHDDRILIEVAGFRAGLDVGGHLSRDQFQIDDGHRADDRGTRFLLDTRDQTLWFDANGSRDGGLRLVVDLPASAELTHQHLWLI